MTALADPAACDVRDAAQVAEAIGPCDVIVHCAAVVTIDDIVRPEVRAVNVGGTANIIDAARRLGARLVYVSSVHALTESPAGAVMREADSFDPDTVVGGYAKTKAESSAWCWRPTISSASSSTPPACWGRVIRGRPTSPTSCADS